MSKGVCKRGIYLGTPGFCLLFTAPGVASGARRWIFQFAAMPALSWSHDAAYWWVFACLSLQALDPFFCRSRAARRHHEPAEFTHFLLLGPHGFTAAGTRVPQTLFKQLGPDKTAVSRPPPPKKKQKQTNESPQDFHLYFRLRCARKMGLQNWEAVPTEGNLTGLTPPCAPPIQILPQQLAEHFRLRWLRHPTRFPPCCSSESDARYSRCLYTLA